MPVEIVKIYSRPEVKDNWDKIYIFGDNFARKGYGGQAQATRDETNAIGIATKASPADYLDDSFYAEVLIREFLPKFTLLKTHLATGGTIVWPEDGIGTGLAKLPEKAPLLWAKLVQLQEWLFNGEIILRDAESWIRTHPNYEGCEIMDPDGWRKEGMKWTDMIPFNEFERRYAECTVKHVIRDKA